MVQYLPGDISAFLQDHPGVRIDLREESTNAVLQSVADGVADIGVYGGNVLAPPGTRVLEYRRDHLVAVLPVDHELAGRDSVAFNEIQGSDHISLETGSSLQVLLAGAAEAAGLKLPVKIEVTTFQAAWRMVEAGLGVAVMPKGVVASAVEEGRVAAAALTDAWAHRQLSICVREGRDLAIPARRLLDHLTAAAPSNSPSAKDALLNREWKATSGAP